jgi:hypothetical protein
MEREDIERAADIYANENRNRGNNVKPYSVVDFISGAEWSISSAWHDASETPQHSGMLIAIKQDGTPIVCGPNNSNWKIAVRIFHIVRWAYIENLLPITC